MGLDPATLKVEQMQYLRIKDWLVDGVMADASVVVVPTANVSTFPQRQHKNYRNP